MERLLGDDNREAIDEANEVSQRFAQAVQVKHNERTTIETIYRQAWHDFYAWEPDRCLQDIAALARPVLRPPEHTFWDALTLEDDMEVDTDSDGADSALSVEVWDPRRQCRTSRTCVEVVIEGIADHPKYEACTPANCNYKLTDDIDLLPFVQYAGDSGFDEREYAAIYARFAWQEKKTFYDPDATLIAFEAVQRLKHMHKLDYEAVESHATLPQILGDGDEGILHKMKQRDSLVWPGLYSVQKEPPLSQNIFTQVNKHIGLFCPSINCVTAICTVHRMHPLALDPSFPRITSTKLISKGNDAPCGHDCYLTNNGPEEEMDMIDFFSSSEMELVDGILKLAPDALPCDLAYICKIPCKQLFWTRSLMFNDTMIEADKAMEYLGSIPDGFVDDQLDIGNNLNFAPVNFCQHPGPCSRTTNCQCFQNKLHCLRNCRCSAKCKLRRKGCKCPKPKCDPDRCPCIKARKECDPELCFVKKPKKGPGRTHKVGASETLKHKCQNMCIQKMEQAVLEVKTAQYGLGTFAVKNIGKESLIGEYVAEMAPAKNWGPGELHVYRGLNYAFAFNKDYILDAALLGNNTRYINHSPVNNNVIADVKWVNGDHKIVFYATKSIKAGAELVFDYGEDYWKSAGGGKDDSHDHKEQEQGQSSPEEDVMSE